MKQWRREAMKEGKNPVTGQRPGKLIRDANRIAQWMRPSAPTLVYALFGRVGLNVKTETTEEVVDESK